jgi:hypothetical protein
VMVSSKFSAVMSIVAMHCSLFRGSSFGAPVGAPHLEDWLLSGAPAPAATL